MAFLGGIFGGNNQGQQAGNQANQNLWTSAAIGNQAIQSGQNAALGDYATNYYDPYSATGQEANTMYANALGLNGAQGNQAATNAFQAGPGYQFALGQGIQALDRSAAGSGMFGSGNAAMALNNYGQGMANQQYGNWLQNLAGLNNQGLQAASGQTGRQGALAGINMWGADAQNRNVMGAGSQGASDILQGTMADVNANQMGGANLWNALLGGANLGAKYYSDRRDKTDIRRLGKDAVTDMPIYAYRYKGDSKAFPKVIGPMAQDIEKRRPDLVHEIGGHKVISANWMTELAKAA
jgi:hypothetical protein